MSGIEELANHAIRACEAEVGANTGPKFAAALSAQAAALRRAADKLDAACLKALLAEADRLDTVAQP